MIVVAIDIGRSGGLCRLEDGSLLALSDMPDLATNDGIKQLREFLAASPQAIVYFEDVHAWSGQGVTSTFNFGRSRGIVEALAVATCKEALAITPQRWKAHYPSLKGLEKAAQKAEAVRLATTLEPSGAFQRPKKRGKGSIALDGRAEAYLIARYGLSLRS